MEVSYFLLFSIWKSLENFLHLDETLRVELALNTPPLRKTYNFSNDATENGRNLEKYLRGLLKNPKLFLRLGFLHAFIQISGLNYQIPDTIYQQDVVRKKFGGHNRTSAIMRFFRKFISGWTYRWFAITSEGICYAKNYSETANGLVDMMFFDKTVKIRLGLTGTGSRYGRI